MSKPVQSYFGSCRLSRRRNAHWGLRNDRFIDSNLIIIIYAQFSSIIHISTCYSRQGLAIVISKTIIRSEEIRKFGFVDIL